MRTARDAGDAGGAGQAGHAGHTGHAGDTVELVCARCGGTVVVAQGDDGLANLADARAFLAEHGACLQAELSGRRQGAPACAS